MTTEIAGHRGTVPGDAPAGAGQVGPAHPARLVVGVDDVAQARGPLDWVAWRAGMLGAHVLLRHGWSPAVGSLPGADVGGAMIEAERAAAQARIGHAAAVLRDRGLDPLTESVCGDAADLIVQGTGPGDEIVLGTPSGFWAHPLGGIVNGVLRAAVGPVVVVQSEGFSAESGAGRVVVGWDGTDLAESALTWAIDLARLAGGHVDVLQVSFPDLPYTVPRMKADEAVAGLIDRVRNCGVPVTMTAGLSCGDGVASALVDAAKGSLALVVGNHRAGWPAALVGASITEGMAHHVACPLVAVPLKAISIPPAAQD